MRCLLDQISKYEILLHFLLLFSSQVNIDSQATCDQIQIDYIRIVQKHFASLEE